MLRIFFFPAFQQRNFFQKIIFMQDGASPYIAVHILPTEWPPLSPDPPCDFWLWGYLKSKVYQDVIQDLAALKDNITRMVREIPAEMLFSAFINAVHRMQSVVHKNGGDI